MCEVDEKKKFNGQFFTITNPFIHNAFYLWFEAIPEEKKHEIIEPFAGSNNIVKMINDLKLANIQWHCYDIEPSELNVVPEFPVKLKDTIKDFPSSDKCYIAITNPPYLAKNSATRSGLPFLYPEYDDVYKKCLEIMLDNCEYVAAIIPESFITANLFHNRLKAVISLTCKMFDDTECPVCLALFSPEKEIDKSNGFDIFRQGQKDKIGTFNKLNSMIKKSTYKRDNWIFNDKNGIIGINCCDNTKKPTIRFIRGSLIEPESIKVSSRAKTRVSGLPNEIDVDVFINKCNEVLDEYRENTKDVFLTSFKGLRDDGMYRRRLDFDSAKNIMSYVLEKIENER